MTAFFESKQKTKVCRREENKKEFIKLKNTLMAAWTPWRTFHKAAVSINLQNLLELFVVFLVSLPLPPPAEEDRTLQRPAPRPDLLLLLLLGVVDLLQGLAGAAD